MSETRWVRVSLRTECPRCGSHLPINGPQQRTDCRDCGADVDLDEGIVLEMLGEFEREYPDVPSEPRGTVWHRGDMTYRTTLVERAPACPHCQRPLEVDASAVAIACACGQRVRVEKPPGWLRSRRPTAKLVVGAEPQDVAISQATEPVAMRCPGCAAGLSIDVDRQRVAPCEYCGVPVHIPDAVWRQLHPVRTVMDWFVGFQGETVRQRKEREAREKAEKQRKHQEEARRKRREKEEKQAAEDKAAREEKEREQAERKARRTAEAKRHGRIRMALTLVAFLPALGALGFTVLALGWLFFGNRAVPLWIHWPGSYFLFDVVVSGIAMSAQAFAGVVTIGSAAYATRTRFTELLFGLLPFVAMSLLPTFGLAVGAYAAHLVTFQKTRMQVRGANGKTRSEKVQFGPWGLPLALVLLAWTLGAQGGMFYFTGLSIFSLID